MYNLKYIKERILKLKNSKLLSKEIIKNTNLILDFCIKENLPIPYDIYPSEEGETQFVWQIEGLAKDGFHFLSNINCRNIEMLICEEDKIICNKNMGNISISFDEEKESYVDEECDKEMYVSDTEEIYNFINWVIGNVNGKSKTETKY